MCQNACRSAVGSNTSSKISKKVMMDNFSINTPSLLFPAISLLMLAYTNRFLAISSIIRQLYEHHSNNPHDNILRQLGNLRQRVWLIR
ncbi:MAG: DUF2721 domain-containing protein, partial [Deefgea sp.]